MDKIEIIRKTIKGKWYDLFFEKNTNKSCSLCDYFNDSRDNDCVDCPIFLYTTRHNCHDTPYWGYRKHLKEIHSEENEYTSASGIFKSIDIPSMIYLNTDRNRNCCHIFIREELLFLFKILRIERKRCQKQN